MIFDDGWYWPDSEVHMRDWVKAPRNRVMLNNRPAYQGKKQVALLELCKNRRTFVDIGAHIGTWSYNFGYAFETVRAFEPLEAHRECLALNVGPNVVVHPVALGASNGTVSMYTGPNSTGDSWIDPDKAGDVTLTTLDSYTFQNVDAIKIDCEGYEENVLRGAVDTLNRCKPVICVEQKRDFAKKYGLRPQGAVAYLEGRGYRVAREIGGDYLMIPTK